MTIFHSDLSILDYFFSRKVEGNQLNSRSAAAAAVYTTTTILETHSHGSRRKIGKVFPVFHSKIESEAFAAVVGIDAPKRDQLTDTGKFGSFNLSFLEFFAFLGSHRV